MDCFELFSTKMGTMIDFRWVRWELKPGKLNETGMTEQAQGGQSTEGLTHISSSNYESIKKKQNGVQLHGVRMNLHNVSMADGGYYSCIGCNYLGCATRSARLTIIPGKDIQAY